MYHLKISIFLVLISLSGASLSGELSYSCKIKHIYDLSNDGSLKASYFEKILKGKTFSVSRMNGEIIGKGIPTVLANSFKVVNRGSKDYSFKTVALFDSVNKPFSKGDETSEYTANVQLLEIQEFSDNKIKTFIAMSMSGVGLVTGTCE